MIDRFARRGLIGVAMMLLASCRLAPLTPLPPVAPEPAIASNAPVAATANGPSAHGATPTAAATPAPAARADSLQRVDPATPDEVVSTAVAVFGDTLAVAGADSTAAEDAEPVWDIDVRSYETHDRVEYYVELFANKSRDRFVRRLSRGTRYDGMIRSKLRLGGMPEDLTYLALIESGYDPHAYSRAAAVGIWQFMSSTARDLGMRVDWWMDERRDPARSTDGAIRFLGYLQKQFGSLYLAAAAYNGGPGRVSRGLTRFADELEGRDGEDRFFALAEQDFLRAETKNYVPQLIAAALVAKKPARYGISYDSLPPYVYDSVAAAPGTSLAVITAASGGSTSDLRELNPAILRGITPPDATVWVRVPVGSAERIRTVLDSLPASEVRGYRSVTVEGKSTTMAGFAQKHRVSLKHLRWFNPGMKSTKKGRLVTGQSLRIPDADALRFARELPDPSIERYAAERPTGRASGRTASASSSRSRVHVVRRGETLGTIARRYALTESRLRALNGLRSSRLLAGQTLVVRAAPKSTAKSKGASAKKSSAKSPTVKKGPAKKASAKKKSAAKRKPSTKKSSSTKKTQSRTPRPR